MMKRAGCSKAGSSESFPALAGYDNNGDNHNNTNYENCARRMYSPLLHLLYICCGDRNSFFAGGPLGRCKTERVHNADKAVSHNGGTLECHSRAVYSSHSDFFR